MARRRRYLVAMEVINSDGEGFARAMEQRLLACPEALQYSNVEVEHFLSAAQYVDTVNATALAEKLRRARVAFPIDIAYDPYRLGRHLFRRWRDPVIRGAFLERVMDLDYRSFIKIKQKGDVQSLATYANHFGAPAIFHMMRECAMAELIPQVEGCFSPEQAARHQALYQFGRLTLHRFLTEPEPARRPSRWEQRKLVRRLHLREVQVRTLRRNLLKLHRERKALLSRLRATERRDNQELNALAAELEQIRAAQGEAERSHAAALEALSRRCREEIAYVQAEVASAEQDYTTTLALRNAWLSMAGGDHHAGGLAVSVSKERLGFTNGARRRAAGDGSGGRSRFG